MYRQKRWYVIGAPIIVGVLWASLWVVIYRLASLMDAMEAMGDSMSTVLGRVVVFHVWLVCYAGAMLLIPGAVWWLSKGKWSSLGRILVVLYTLVTPVLIGFCLWALGSRYLGWVERVWRDWQQWSFALHRLVVLLLMTGIVGQISTRWEKRKSRA